jgi:ubiquitin C-terminal hydrolase
MLEAGVAVDSSLLESALEIVEDLLNRAFTDPDTRKAQPVLLNLISNLITHSSVHRTNVLTSLSKFLEPDIDRWPFLASEFRKHSPFAGLRNLSATCFVNSILQQLFHLFPVRRLLMTYDFPEGSELLSLQRLFLSMPDTHRVYADPADFVKSSHGWHGEALNPHDQQDAVEFLLILLDFLPSEYSSLFRFFWPIS